jgi:protein-disulfide isomerase
MTTQNFTVDSAVSSPTARPSRRLLVTVAWLMLLALAIVAGRYWDRAKAWGPAASGRRPSGLSVGQNAIASHSPRRGADVPQVTFIEVAEFPCRNCANGAAAVNEMFRKYGNQAAFTFVHNPVSGHPDALPASVAAMAAARQGKFWEYRDKLFAHHGALGAADLERYAREVGLDLARFKRDRADPAIAAQIQADKQLAQALGVTTPPTFLINGRKVSGPRPVAWLDNAVQFTLKKGSELLAKGVPTGEITRQLTDEELRVAAGIR